MTQTSLPNAPMHPRADGPVAMAPGIRRAQVLGDNEAHAAAHRIKNGNPVMMISNIERRTLGSR